jgi:PAS domain S-box-containing protein
MKTKSFTILNVDDSLEYLRTHSHFLKSEGYKVLEAKTGNECLRLTKKHKPDLILLDVVLPDIYGIEVCRQIKTNVDTKQTLILLISGYEIESDAQVRGFEAGADDYLVKPISKNELLAHVRVMERIKRSEDELREVALLLEQRVKERTKAIEKTNQELQNEIAEHKRADEALRESEQRFQVLAENSPVGIFQTDAKGSTIYVNPRWCQISGLSKEEAMGTGWLSAIHGDDKEKLSNGWKKATQAHDSSIADYRFVHKDGTITWVIGQAIPKRNSKNKIVGYVGTITDITEHKLAEAALAEETTRRRILFEQSPDGIVILDPQTARFIEFNTAAHRQLGYSREEFAKLSINDVEAEETQDETRATIARVIRERRVDFETLQHTKDGEIRNVNVTAQYIDIEGHPVYHCIWRDITDQKRVEEELKKSEEKYRSIFGNVQDVYYEISFDGTILEISPSVEFISKGQYHRADLIGISVFDIYSDIKDHDTFMAALWKTGSVTDLEVRLKNRDGSYILCSFSAKIYFDAQGKPEKIIGSMHDITERKRAEEALRENEEKFRVLFEQLPIGISLLDKNRKVMQVNPALEKILGISKDDLLQEKHQTRRYIRSDGTTMPAEEFASARAFKEQKLVRDIETGVITESGKTIWTSVSAAPFPMADKGLLIVTADITERKQAEDGLKKSEEKYRSIFENVQDVYYETSFDGTVLEVSPSIEFISKGQYHRTDLIGRSMYEFYADTKNRDAIISAIQKTGSVTDFEVRFKNRDGSLIHCSISAKISFNAGGRPEKIIGSMHDITERKQAEETLSLLNHTIKSTSECISITDLNNKILFVNQAFLKTYGYTEEEVVGKPIYIVRAEKIENKDTVFDMTLQGGWHGELSNRKKDGTIFPVSLSTSVVHNEKKQPIALVGVAVDITERKRAEEALQESELRFRSLYENATIGIYRTTPDGNILLANPALVKMLGYTSFQELAERNLEKDGFESSSQRKEFLEKIERDGEVNGYESKWIRQDGTVIFVLESARSIRDSQGKTLYYDGTVEDMTERRQMEEGLRQMQKLEGLGTLAGGIAHDFNNILGIILAYITSTKRFKDDTKKLDLAVDTIVKAVERGKTLVQQILTFARKTETTFGAVDVNDVVMEIMTMIYETFPKILTYAQNFDKSVHYINADRSQLHQVLLNLCVNARDAMPTGGVLTINTRMVSGLSLRNQHPDIAASDYVCIEVSDTGEGMTEEIKERLFEPFFTTKGIGKGTGLGLSVVFGVAQTHKGFIDVESELGKGTTFRLYLPASQVAAPISVKDEETLEEIPGGTETLLVVEDEEMLMMSLQMVLVEKGYNVLSAGDGLTALKIYQEKKNDIALVLTDLGLPTITGLEVCQRIKKINPNEHIILATGFLDPEMKGEFLKAGVQHFLYKPYDLKKVLKVVREVLDGK